MRLIDADALIEDSKKYLNTLNPDNDGKECAKIYWLINVLNESPAVERDPDTISRAAAIDGVKTLHEVAWKNWHEPTLSANVVIDMIKELPSAQPTGTPLHDNGSDYAHGFADGYKNGLKDAKSQRKGYWRHYEGYLTCSECGDEYYADIMAYCGDNVPKFCPNCGADMREENR